MVIVAYLRLVDLCRNASRGAYTVYIKLRNVIGVEHQTLSLTRLTSQFLSPPPHTHTPTDHLHDILTVAISNYSIQVCFMCFHWRGRGSFLPSHEKNSCSAFHWHRKLKLAHCSFLSCLTRRGHRVVECRIVPTGDWMLFLDEISILKSSVRICMLK